MKSYTKYLSMACIGIILCYSIVTQSDQTITFTSILLKFSFSDFDIAMAGINDLFIWYSPLLFFQFYFGVYIYRHYCCASVYFFSRCENRIRWFLKEAGVLYVYTLLYIILMLTSGTVSLLLRTSVTFDREAGFMLLYYLVLHSVWLYLLSLLINILSILINSSAAFIIIGGVQMACIALYASWSNIEFGISEKTELLLKSNPLSHLVLSWHSSNIERIDKLINRFGISFDLNKSVFLFLIFAILAIIFGSIIVSKKDLILANQETGGIS